jgi:hypothetical protein
VVLFVRYDRSDVQDHIVLETLMKASGVTAALARLDSDRSAVPRDEALAIIRKGLAAKSNLTVADAACLAGELDLGELQTELLEVFDAFMDEEQDRADKRCLAKTAIVRTLHQLGCTRTEVYLRGARHFANDHPRRGHNDEASELRVASALALGDSTDPEARETLLELLVDPAPSVRAMAVRSIASLPIPSVSLLLRLKLLIDHDETPPVVEECLAALLAGDAERSIPFVARFLDDPNDATRTSAAIALGESRLSPAGEALLECYRRTFDADFRATLLHALAMQRQESTTRFILQVIEEGGADAENALLSLAPYHALSGIREQVEVAVNKAAKEALRKVFERKFPKP